MDLICCEKKESVEMQRIIVSLDSIKQKLTEIEKDDMEFIELNIIPSQTDNRYISPAFLHLDGVSRNGARKDYESIDARQLQENAPRRYHPVLVPLNF